MRNTKQAVQLSFPNTSGAWNIAQEVKTVGIDVSDGRVRNVGAPTDIDDATRLGDLQAVENSLDAQIVAGDAALQVQIDDNVDRIDALEEQAAQFQSFGNYDGINDVLLGGSGDFSVVRDSTGVYTFTFTEAAASLYAQSLVANNVGVFNSGADVFYVIPTSTTTWQVTSYSANGQFINTSFSFMRVAN